MRTEQFIAAVERSVEEDPNESTGHLAQLLELYPYILWKFLRKDLDLRACKIQLVKELIPHDNLEHRMFGEAQSFA